jgi:hypothetical protein
MCSPARRALGVVLALVVAASAVEAQSLADIARQEEARRKNGPTGGKVYTNDNVRNDRPAPPAPSAAAPSPGTPSTTPADPKAGEAAKAAPAPEAAATEKKDEAYWRARIQTERDALSRAQMFAEALQSRINGLSADFTARDDPAQRSAIAKDREKALGELERVRKEIQDHTKALATVQEDGRKAGAPAGWLR